MKNWHQINNLRKHEKRHFSQNGEDGVLAFILDNIGTESKYCVELGAMDGKRMSNTYHIRTTKKFKSLLVDKNPRAKDVVEYTIKRHTITKLFNKEGVPEKYDLLSIDLDGNDLWIWKAIKKHVANVVIVEFNPSLPKGESLTIEYNNDHVFNQTNYFGASFEAFKKLGAEKGYELVYCVANMNLIFVRKELLPEGFVSEVDYEVRRGWPPNKDESKKWVKY